MLKTTTNYLWVKLRGLLVDLQATGAHPALHGETLVMRIWSHPGEALYKYMSALCLPVLRHSNSSRSWCLAKWQQMLRSLDLNRRPLGLGIKSSPDPWVSGSSPLQTLGSPNQVKSRPLGLWVKSRRLNIYWSY